MPVQSPTAALRDHLLRESRLCRRSASGRFDHEWLSPMPARGAAPAPATGSATDIFNTGDYSHGLFHHDASEASIELLRHAEFRDACRGSLLNFLGTMRPDGLIRRVEMPTRSHEAEPAKPVLAQFARRCARAFDNDGEARAWLARHDIYPRLRAFIDYWRREWTGMHGLMLAPTALQTGFDNDLLLVNAPDGTIEDPGTSAFMVLEYEAMADLAALLGANDEARGWRDDAQRLRRWMNELMWWEPRDDPAAGAVGWYAALRFAPGAGSIRDEVVMDPSRGGASLPAQAMLSWTSLLPLYAGVPDAARAERLIRLLLDPARFWGPLGVRTAPRDALYFNQSARTLIHDAKIGTRTAVSNWQGPVWVLSNYYLAEGLARYGRTSEARTLAERTRDLLGASLRERGTLFENYNDAGDGLWPHSGGFVSWNVLALTLIDRYASGA